MLMLPLEDRRGEVPPVSIPGEWVTMISAPWSTRALAVSRKLSLWLSICWVKRKNASFHPSTFNISAVLFLKFFSLHLEFINNLYLLPTREQGSTFHHLLHVIYPSTKTDSFIIFPTSFSLIIYLIPSSFLSYLSITSASFILQFLILSLHPSLLPDVFLILFKPNTSKSRGTHHCVRIVVCTEDRSTLKAFLTLDASESAALLDLLG